MSAPSSLQASWTATLAQAGLADPEGRCWSELEVLYGAADRHYHTLDHVAACLTHLAGTERDHAPLRLALFYHDAVYDTHRHDNEEASARLAERRLEQMGAEAHLLETVVTLILATTHRDEPAGPDAALLCDIDLATLGSSEPGYRAYAEAIRREYAWVPDEDYRAGRSRVLNSFLARDRIYHTEPFHSLEAPARSNLERELATLTLS